MRIVRFVAAFIMSLVIGLLVPIVAAAASFESLPHAGPGGIFITVAAAGLGIGAVYYVQRGKSLYSGGLRRQGDRVEMSEGEAESLVAKGILAEDAPEAVPAPAPPAAGERNQTEEDVMSALETLNERTTLLEKQVQALQETSSKSKSAGKPPASGKSKDDGDKGTDA